MLTSILKYVYAVNALVLSVMIIYGKLFVFKKKEATFVSDFCAVITFFLCTYVILSLLYVGILPNLLGKVLMLIFACTPFVYGLLANYYSEKYFTAIQIFTFALSVAYLL
ncbi:MAG: hypothetical protein NC200_05830 [Candidatus Gastranaerophilales bacterium]|nr:hypothetical protein [Candidatus Gastranaerophilales bacterium]